MTTIYKVVYAKNGEYLSALVADPLCRMPRLKYEIGVRITPQYPMFVFDSVGVAIRYAGFNTNCRVLECEAHSPVLQLEDALYPDCDDLLECFWQSQAGRYHNSELDNSIMDTPLGTCICTSITPLKVVG